MSTEKIIVFKKMAITQKKDGRWAVVTSHQGKQTWLKISQNPKRKGTPKGALTH
jgi:hypothetical protein